jgi:hypothetical protein
MFRNVSLTGLGLTTLLLVVGAYFTFTAVQGNYGLFQRIQIEAEAERLEMQLAALRREKERMEILTRRLSDDFSTSTCWTNARATCWATGGPTNWSCPEILIPPGFPLPHGGSAPLRHLFRIAGGAVRAELCYGLFNVKLSWHPPRARGGPDPDGDPENRFQNKCETECLGR